MISVQQQCEHHHKKILGIESFRLSGHTFSFRQNWFRIQSFLSLVKFVFGQQNPNTHTQPKPLYFSISCLDISPNEFTPIVLIWRALASVINDVDKRLKAELDSCRLHKKENSSAVYLRLAVYKKTINLRNSHATS